MGRWPLQPAGRIALIAVLSVLLTHTVGYAASGRNKPDHTGLAKFSSRFYIVYTNLSRDQARGYADHMDKVFAEYTYRFRSFRAKGRGAMPLYLFKTKSDYLGFLLRHGIDGSSSGGMFFVSRRVEGLATWTHGRSRRRVLEVLQHEGFHQFASHRIGRTLPVWVNEGIAEYFEKGIIVRGKMTLGLAPVESVTYIRNMLDQRQTLGFDYLFRLDHELWGRNMGLPGDRGRLQYAQSWSIVHFLVHAENGRFQPALMKYLALVSQGEASDKAFLLAFQASDTRAFRDRWEEFIRSLKPDPIGTTLDRMVFLGQGLEYFHEKGQPRPTDLTDLKDRLQRVKFKIHAWQGGAPVLMSALDDTLFEFPNGKGGTGQFELLEPAADNLPQRIGAPGSKPEPILTWRYDEDGELVSDFEFR